jgi:hypothetical protein
MHRHLRSKVRAAQFEKELKALLNKYNTAIELNVVRTSVIGNEYSMQVTLPELRSDDFSIAAESAEIDLGSYYCS